VLDGYYTKLRTSLPKHFVRWRRGNAENHRENISVKLCGFFVPLSETASFTAGLISETQAIANGNLIGL